MHRLLLGALLATAAAPGQAQSTDRDRPTPLVSPEVTGRITLDRMGEHFYRFMAGPGELSLTLEVRPISGFSKAYADVTDADARELLAVEVGAGDRSERTVKRVRLNRAQAVVLRVGTNTSADYAATYLVRLGGAFTGAREGSTALTAGAAEGRLRVPERGTLRIEMTNGMIQDVDLRLVRKVLTLPPL
jgi:hypothetical protein